LREVSQGCRSLGKPGKSDEVNIKINYILKE
jgi:hypothetical protein